ncbi:MAG: LacI family DNA-binding transcriptional regulator [Acidimicrobiales bacterium]
MGDVAALAGVSRKTVSRVFNSEPTVAEELVFKVRRAADQLNYKMNLVASDLRRTNGRPSTIGLLIQDVSNEFSASIFRSVENVAEQQGVTVLASNIDEDPNREHDLTSSLIARRVDGLILIPASLDQSYLSSDQRSGTPIVFLDRPPLLLKADTVLSDNEAGAHMGVSHLLEGGHRRIGFIGEPDTHAPSRDRFSGYVRALQQRGIAIDPELIIRNQRSEVDARDAVQRLLSMGEPPTAMFTAHNRLTVGAVTGLRDRQSEHTIALVGFDDFALAYLLQPGITVIAQDPATMGQLGAEILFRRIRGDRGDAETHVVPTTLIERGSGEIASAASVHA